MENGFGGQGKGKGKKEGTKGEFPTLDAVGEEEGEGSKGEHDNEVSKDVVLKPHPSSVEEGAGETAKEHSC